jgi:23S rRNA (cytidine1920-2'-O)/16S rRNA (cytidine1409-2'-O)-methyltransferase
MTDPPCPYVSRGGLKLAAALDAFAVNPRGLVCADRGCNVGGFTDCLLQRDAARVFCVDTGYGALAWKLRQDARVVVLERTNALHFDPWAESGGLGASGGFAGCDLVVIDLAWTRQQHAIPAALRWLRPAHSTPPSPAAEAATDIIKPTAAPGRIITLIKPHYEADRTVLGRGHRGVLTPDDAQAVMDRLLGEIPVLGVRIVGRMPSPIRGGAGKGRTGNLEYLALLERD